MGLPPVIWLLLVVCFANVYLAATAECNNETCKSSCVSQNRFNRNGECQCPSAGGEPICVCSVCPKGLQVPNYNCGRGGKRCTESYYCEIEKGDAYAVCCPK